MVENAIARFLIPIGLATNFIIDGKEVLIPMATDESGSIAGASLAAKLARPSGGFVTTCEPNICSGQIFFISSGPDSLTRLLNLSDSIRRIPNEAMPGMTTRTGGTDSITLRQVDTDSGSLVVVELHVRVGDSMGANTVTVACETIRTFVRSELNLEPLMGIVTNLAKKRMVTAAARWRIADIGLDDYDGFDIANRIILAARFAALDPNRGATHRKGIMNGISAVVLATGNDTRAVEAAVHSFAALPEANPALTSYRIEDNSVLVGEIAIPVPIGTVGGSINRNADSAIVRKLMKVETADELARTIAAVGLAQNFAALRALVTQGITAGHIKIHSRDVASEAGARGDEIDAVATKLLMSGKINLSSAITFLREMRCELT
jgi:degradative hydroxymethylglutaryl-CoA reductase